MPDEQRRRSSPPSSGGEYRRLFEDSRDAIYVGTVDGRLLDVNPAGVTLFGYGSREGMLSIDPAAASGASPAGLPRGEETVLLAGNPRPQGARRARRPAPQ